MATKQETDPNAPVPTAEELRMTLLQKEMEEMEQREKAREVEQRTRAAAAEDFLKGHVTDKERELIRRLVMNAVAKGQLEAMIYSFPSDLCTDRGRAINNSDPQWPDTLQGKARELYEGFKENLQPKGYKLKAMIINFPGGMPGDVGLYLNWEPKRV
ncbi:hypothetical protein [Paracoccus benzoatiresistens]|uniref:Histidine kinase n=1 Tax=Paracoccus benzoatiresistens TaxID=2997341 RepID=A0ABT4J6A8_9RHOB|nr:hypothetical protein [Paracoccus sp. EF6]MCZ0962612.1 hypothetical protein [Paracoccus sp. EF6]